MMPTARTPKWLQVVGLTLSLLVGASNAQDAPTIVGGVRVTTCAGVLAGTLDITGICNITGFLETGPMGVLAQISPRYGVPWENWLVFLYTPRTQLDLLGVQVFLQPGVAGGLQQGSWFFRIESDVIIQWAW